MVMLIAVRRGFQEVLVGLAALAGELDGGLPEEARVPALYGQRIELSRRVSDLP